MPTIEQIAAPDGLQIKDLPDQFPTRANRELNRPNRERNRPNREAPEKHQGHAGLAWGLAFEPVRGEAVEVGAPALLVLIAG